MKYHVSVDIELRRNPYKGLYFALEGIDGSGKSTQAGKLKKYLESKGKNVTATSEPRKEESPIGILIHQILQAKVHVPLEAMQYLYTAERIANHRDIVYPALEAGNVVITHRCLWSNLPYGMLDRDLPDYDSNDGRVIDVAHGLLSLYHQFIVPDITFYLRIDAATAMRRLLGMGKQMEIYEKKEKLMKIAKGYEWEVVQFPEEFIIIDGEKPEDAVFEQIRSVVEKKLNGKL